MAVLLRPEAIWWAAIWVAVAPRTRASFVAGLAVVGGAFVGINVAEGAPPLGFHAAANVGVMGDAWLLARLHRFEAWLFPASPWFISALATAFVGGVLRRTGGVESARLAGLAAAVLVAAGSVSGDFSRDSLWWAFPIGGLLLTASAYADRRDLVLLWGTAAAVLLTSTHDGGAQWGPRILLIVTPVLLLCAASALSDAIAPGRLQTLRFVLVGLLICCGAWTSRHAYVDLRGWKRYYGTLAQSLERESNTGDYIVTNTWWLDQVAATLYPSRTFLVASTPTEMTDVLDRLHDAGIEKIRVAWSDDPGEAGAPLLDGSCYRFESRRRLAERQVTIATAALDPASKCDAASSAQVP